MRLVALCLWSRFPSEAATHADRNTHPQDQSFSGSLAELQIYNHLSSDFHPRVLSAASDLSDVKTNKAGQSQRKGDCVPIPLNWAFKWSIGALPKSGNCNICLCVCRYSYKMVWICWTITGGGFLKGNRDSSEIVVTLTHFQSETPLNLFTLGGETESYF